MSTRAHAKAVRKALVALRANERPLGDALFKASAKMQAWAKRACERCGKRPWIKTDGAGTQICERCARGAGNTIVAGERPARNDACPCRSGRKGKACCGPAIRRNNGPHDTEAFRARVTECGACGGAHTEVIFYPTRTADGPTHWAKCPSLGLIVTIARPRPKPECA